MIQVENNKDLKYEYSLKTWGGFYNKQYQDIHGEVEGTKYFNTKEERDLYISKLDNISGTLEAKMLCKVLDEGFTTRVMPVIHRVVKYKDKYYYSKDEINFSDFEFGGISYICNWKWTPGFNDEILEDILDEEINYEEVTIVQEWITGAFKPNES